MRLSDQILAHDDHVMRPRRCSSGHAVNQSERLTSTGRRQNMDTSRQPAENPSTSGAAMELDPADGFRWRCNAGKPVGIDIPRDTGGIVVKFCPWHLPLPHCP